MSYLTKIKNHKENNIYSVSTYFPYEDVELIDIIQGFKSNDRILINDVISELVDLYKNIIMFNEKEPKIIAPMVYEDNDIYTKINYDIASELSKKLGIELADDFIKESIVKHADVDDYYMENALSNLIEIDNKYYENVIVFDFAISTGIIVNNIIENYKNSIFLSYAIRYDSVQLKKTFIASISEMENLSFLDNNYNIKKRSGYVVKVKGLFDEYDYSVDLRQNLSIIIGPNGIGKSTLFKIITLAIMYFEYEDYHARILLSKYYFKSIELTYYNGDNKIEKIGTVLYNEIIPARKMLIENAYKFLADILGVSDCSPSTSGYTNLIESIKEALDVISDNEYSKLYKKIALNDCTQVSYLNELAKKHNLDSKKMKASGYFLKEVIDNLSLENRHDSDALLSKKISYYNVTKSRRIKIEKMYEKYEDVLSDFYGISIDDKTLNERLKAQSANSFEHWGESLCSLMKSLKLDNENKKAFKSNFISENEIQIEKLFRFYNGNCNDLIIDSAFSNLLKTFDKNLNRDVTGEKIEVDSLNDYFNKFTLSLHSYLDYSNEDNVKIFKYMSEKIFDRKIGLLDGSSDGLRYRKLITIKEKIYDNECPLHMKNTVLRFLNDFYNYYLESIPDEDKIINKYINKYLVNKRLMITPNGILVVDGNDNIVPLDSLSSGERNIIIIFSLARAHISFGVNERFAFIFDEPDISLGYKWQESLIQDLRELTSDLCNLFILTQSPQVVTNPNLHKFVVNIIDNDVHNEFLIPESESNENNGSINKKCYLLFYENLEDAL